MHHRWKALTTTASITVLLLAGATPSHATRPAGGMDGAAGRAATAPPVAASYDGQTLFAGLVLGYGPVAEQFPELATGRVETPDPRAAAEVVELIAAAVEEVDPTFFDGFGAAITSGDRVQIDRALRSAEDVLITAVTEELDASIRGGNSQIDTAFAVALAVVVVAVVTLAATVNTVANINATVNVNVTVNVDVTSNQPIPAPPPPTPESMPRIDHEKRVDRIAEAMAR